MNRPLLAFLFFIQVLGAQEYRLTKIDVTLYEEPDRLANANGLVAAGTAIKLIAATTSSKWVRVKTIFENKNIEGYTLISNLSEGSGGIDANEKNCLEIKNKKITKSFFACLGSKCRYSSCGDSKALFFLPKGHLIILPPCPKGGKPLKGTWHLDKNKILFAANLKDSLKACRRRCKKKAGKQCKRNCNRLFKQRYKSKKIQASARGQVDLSNTSQVVVTLRATGRTFSANYRHRDMGCFRPIEIKE